jgi:hypothetical protein
LSCRVAHHALVFGEERVEFKEINTAELKCHRIANDMSGQTSSVLARLTVSNAESGGQ